MDISHILNDCESGSVALLNRLVGTLEDGLHGTRLSVGAFRTTLLRLREKLHHFAAIDNFLAELIRHVANQKSFPEEALLETEFLNKVGTLAILEQVFALPAEMPW